VVFAEFETNLRRERQMEGIAEVKQRDIRAWPLWAVAAGSLP